MPPQAECCVPAPPILEFDMAGNLVQSWGGPGDGYEWPDNEHGIFVDHKDNVWVGGSGPKDDQILKFTNRGRFLLQIGRKGQNQGSNDTANLGGPANLVVHPRTNEVFVADGYRNRRIIVFDADSGAYKRDWGAYGKRPEDAKNPAREQIIQGPPPTFFNNAVHDVKISSEDLVYVADRSNNRIQVFRLDGTFVKEGFIARNTLAAVGTVLGLAFSPDKEQRFLYVADGPNKWVRILTRQSLEVVGAFGGYAGHGVGQFSHLHNIGGADSKGNLYTGEADGARAVKWAFKGMASASPPSTR